MSKKISIFIIFSQLILITLFLFIPQSVSADGMMMEIDPYENRWDFSDERNQQAFINYENGVQKMIISVGIKKGNTNGIVWLFPIPSDPNKITIDVVGNLPKLQGENITDLIKMHLDPTVKILQASQIYTIPILIMNYFNSLETNPLVGWGGTDSTTLSSAGGIDLGIEQDVIVYEHVDKEGIASEIITAKTTNGIFDYLRNKGLNIDSGSIPVLDNYIGKNYSFIVSWISSPQGNISVQDIANNVRTYLLDPNRYPNFTKLIRKLSLTYPGLSQNVNAEVYFNSEEGLTALQTIVQAIQNDPSIIMDDYAKPIQKGIAVTFPTNDLYFPLLPTSVYGSKVVPATIRIIGHVSPKIFQDIKEYSSVKYYFERDNVDVYNSKDFKVFYGDSGRDIKYTRIEIFSPSKLLTEDLWIKNQTPIKTYFFTLMAQHPIISGILLFILISIISGLLAGLIFFKDLRKKPLKLCLIGLSNCLTLLGLIITTILIRTKNIDESLKPLLDKIEQLGYSWKRKIALILILVSLPILAFGLLLIGFEIFSRWTYREWEIIIPLLILNIVCSFITISGLVIKRIKTSDKYLFDQLKFAGYSSWSFAPKDKLKIAFVPIFSITFLLVSWLLIDFIKFII